MVNKGTRKSVGLLEDPRLRQKQGRCCDRPRCARGGVKEAKHLTPPPEAVKVQW